MGYLGNIGIHTFRTYKIINTFYFLPTIFFRIKDMTPIDGATGIENWKTYAYELCWFNYALSCERIKEITKDECNDE